MKKKQGKSTSPEQAKADGGSASKVSSFVEELKCSPEKLLTELFGSPMRIRGALNTVSLQELISGFSTKISKDHNSPLRMWTRSVLKGLESFHISSDVERLATFGTRPETLAIAMMVIRVSRQFDGMFSEFGDKRIRHRRLKALLTPIPVLEELGRMFGDVSPELRESRYFPYPARVISDLNNLSYLCRGGEWLSEILGAKCLFEVSRFALASLVHDVTGKFRDREMSKLTGAALLDYDYDENRHRVWRIDNYKRLNESIPIATRLLVAFNTVVSQSDPSS
jgi:hypothetical protein